MRTRDGFWTVLAINIALGAPAYFISFLFAYGFRDEVGLAEHLTFLVLITAFAVVCGLLGAAISRTPPPRTPARRRAAFAVLMSLALNMVVVGIGSIVSATHKEENSVSVDFSTTTDVLVASGLFLLAVAFAAAALRVDLRAQPVEAHPST